MQLAYRFRKMITAGVVFSIHATPSYLLAASATPSVSLNQT
jgi:hypothetical protein